MDGTPGSRAVPGFSVFGDNNSSDCYGHGTHTAATVGGQHLDSANSGSCYMVMVAKLLYSHLGRVLLYSHIVPSRSCCVYRTVLLHIVEPAIQTSCTK